jgi:hypothetical protein
MSASVHTLPIWKKGSTPAEWLEELAGLARENPERWAQIAVVFNELNEEKMPTKTRYYSYGLLTNTDILGALQVGILEVFDYMKGRRG